MYQTKQAGAVGVAPRSGVPAQVRWGTVVIAVAAAVILLASLLAGSFAASGGAATWPARESSYEEVEQLRATLSMAAAPVDDSLEHVERARAAFGRPAADTSYEYVERIRAIGLGD
jgi:hypothetical protein